MRIQVQLPQVKPEEHNQPENCPYCGGQHFKPHGPKGEVKRVRDLDHDEVRSYRYTCMRCHRSFRVYPPGVSQYAQQTTRLKAMSVLLYVLGLSYGGVADFLTALGVPIGKTTIYDNVQAAGIRSRQRQRTELETGGKRAAIGSDGAYVKVKGEKVGIQVIVDDATGDLLGIDVMVSEGAEEVEELLRGVAEQVEAEVLVSDDWDSYKEVADELGLDHQLCRSHVKRNVEELAEQLRKQLRDRQEPVPPDVDSSPEQLEADLVELERLVALRTDDAPEILADLYHRYKAAPKPPPRQRHSVWYRMRMLITRLWNRWNRLTLDLRRDDLEMDGTNNTAERLIGWWIKERYRTMRGYKRVESIFNVVTLTAQMGVRPGQYDMAELYV
jgi:transposase-like protein